MRLRYGFAALLLVGLCAPAQQTPIDTYIHQGWDKLSRSMDDCASFPDSKLAAAPVLYLPAGEKIPAAIRTMQQHCKVDVRHLPRRIHHEGELSPDEIPTPGLLYLPNRYVVPGGRFNEMYGWDSYFILLGELADGRIDLARGTVENFFYEIDHYGSILNANRTYYLTRSQPPFLSSMVLDVYHAEEQENPTEARTFLSKALPYLIRDHTLWVTPPHLDVTTGLSRYFDLGHGPAPEMNDDSTYYIDVIHWLLAHPAEAPTGYLQKATIATTPCAQSGSNVCLQTQADGYELTPSFYTCDRAMRESGFDTSFRFGPFSGSTEDYAPICLNALLYKYERDLAFITATLNHPADAIVWSTTAGDRLHAINSLMWDDATGLYYDYNLRTSQRSTYHYVTTYYALWAGIASPAKAARMAAALPLFDHTGGLAMSTFISGEQWDEPFGWAPTNWLATVGLARYGYTAEAQRIARAFTSTVAKNYALDGTIREKYNVADASANVTVANGYKTNVIGFGWTNGVYVRMMQFLTAPQPASHSVPTPSRNQ
jgi:alpha,alpha-trehalase